MRRQLSFLCEGRQLAATLDYANGETGLLIVTGGRQTRVGPHRLMAQVGQEAAKAGYPVFRFDRRGVGDSEGVDRGFEGSCPDIIAAATAFRENCPGMSHVYALGLCDGATAIALYHSHANLGGMILLNPWVIEASADNPPPAAVRAYYRDRLFSLSGWRRLITRGFNPAALFRGLKTAVSTPNQSLAYDVMTSLAASGIPVHILLARQDATARAFLNEYQSKPGAALRAAFGVNLEIRDTASHSFANGGDKQWLIGKIIAALAGSSRMVAEEGLEPPTRGL